MPADTVGPATVVLGRVGAAHGVRGWVRVQSWARPPESILDFPVWQIRLNGEWQPYEVAESAQTPKGIIVRFAGIEDRDGAEPLRNAEMAVCRRELPEPDAGEWYWTDLIGLQVETVHGEPLGIVDHLLETGANDVLVVRGERERLIPWIPEQVIRHVDPAAQRLVVEWDPDF